MPPQPPRALLCDIDGVIRHYDVAHQHAVEAAHGIPSGTILRVAMDDTLIRPLTVGLLDAEDWQRAIAEGLRDWLPDPDRALEAVLAWRAVSHTDPEVLALLAAAGRRIPVALVTNGHNRIARELAALGVSAVVPTLVNSAVLGAAKPDPAVFEHAAAVVGTEPADCLFVDDTAGHVAAAEAFGMRGLHYRREDGGAARLRDTLGGIADSESRGRSRGPKGPSGPAKPRRAGTAKRPPPVGEAASERVAQVTEDRVLRPLSRSRRPT